MEKEVIMLQIQDALVSLDLAEQFFCCDLDACLGACCIEGDAGAPITQDEQKKIEEILPVVADELLPRAREAVENEGVAYLSRQSSMAGTVRLPVTAKTACACAPLSAHTGKDAHHGKSRHHALFILCA